MPKRIIRRKLEAAHPRSLCSHTHTRKHARLTYFRQCLFYPSYYIIFFFARFVRSVNSLNFSFVIQFYFRASYSRCVRLFLRYAFPASHSQFVHISFSGAQVKCLSAVDGLIFARNHPEWCYVLWIDSRPK